MKPTELHHLGKAEMRASPRGLPNQQTLLFSTFAPLTVTGHVPTDDAQRDSESRCVALSPPCPTTPNSIVILNSCLGFEPVSPSDGALRKTLIYRLHACGDTSKPYLSISSSWNWSHSLSCTCVSRSGSFPSKQMTFSITWSQFKQPVIGSPWSLSSVTQQTYPGEKMGPAVRSALPVLVPIVMCAVISFIIIASV